MVRALIYRYRSEYFQPYTSNGIRIRYVGDVGVWETGQVLNADLEKARRLAGLTYARPVGS